MDGILNVYKEKGYTSFDVVAKLRGILKQKKIGHTGTLDPDAEGVLPVCLGSATRACELLTEKDKEYEAVLLFGQETDTQDVTGKILCKQEVTVSPQEAERALLSFEGDYEQIPPMYSALKVDGRKLCDLAREGIIIDRKPRKVTIHSLRILETSFTKEEQWIRFQVSCSKGTYIRTLCEDAARRAGSVGCMKSLTRTRVSSFFLKDSLKIDEIEAKRDAGELNKIILPVDRLFLRFPALKICPEAELQLYNGNKLKKEWLEVREKDKNRQAAENEELPETDQPPWYRMYDSSGVFYGLYFFSDEEELYRNVKMFIPAK